MKAFAFITAASLFTQSLHAGIISVPGTSGLWLAGMPNGTQGHRDDFAPAQSPAWASDLVLTAGAYIEVSNVSGSVNNAPTGPGFDPDGDLSRIIVRTIGAEHGKSDMVAPINSLIGVFLDASIPTAPVPSTLDFSTPVSRDYLELNPALQQPFYIGNGMTSGLVQQKIFVPIGATRFFLGTMDTRDNYNNWGSFTATVTVLPEPSTMALLLTIGSVTSCFFRRRRIQ